MQKIRVKGATVRFLRKQHPRLSRQKSLAPALSISERKLRQIETQNNTWDIDLVDRLAAALGTCRDEIVFSIDGPKLVPPPAPAAPAPSISRLQGKQLVPRFEKDSARLVRNANDLFDSAVKAHVVKVEIQIDLNSETSAYVKELVALAREASRENQDYILDAEVPRAKQIQERMRWLFVVLKGNDVLAYVCDHIKYLPECDEVPETQTWDYQSQMILAFAPPQEWGEDSVNVDVDNGHPYIIDWDKPLFCLKSPTSIGT